MISAFQQSCPRTYALCRTRGVGATVLRRCQGRSRAPHSVRLSPMTAPPPCGMEQTTGQRGTAALRPARRIVQLGRGGAGSRVCAAEPMKQTRRTGRNTEQCERGDRPKQCDNVSDRKPMGIGPDSMNLRRSLSVDHIDRFQFSDQRSFIRTSKNGFPMGSHFLLSNRQYRYRPPPPMPPPEKPPPPPKEEKPPPPLDAVLISWAERPAM